MVTAFLAAALVVTNAAVRAEAHAIAESLRAERREALELAEKHLKDLIRREDLEVCDCPGSVFGWLGDTRLHVQKCFNCRGTGIAGANGLGNFPCAVCHGKGYALCPKCNGRGVKEK